MVILAPAEPSHFLLEVPPGLVLGQLTHDGEPQLMRYQHPPMVVMFSRLDDLTLPQANKPPMQSFQMLL